MTTNRTTTQRAAPRTRAASIEVRPRLPVLDIPSAISVADLADMMGVDPIDVIKQLMRFGYMISINEVVEFEVASGIAQSFGFPVKAPVQEEDTGPGSVVLTHDDEDPENLVGRPPVVTILGHVDHGKTTLLDSIRNTNVVGGESGGITQHIGAYQVRYNGTPITFLDTPGHEAFTAMRARGAKVTDIAILVVAADDGIMPQTEEAISHVKAAEVPIIVAVNKIDRPDADPDRVKRQLAERDLLVEDWGGDVIAVPVSALKGEGIDDLLENIIVVSEVAELKANPDQLARGVVVEAQIDKSKGPVATVLVQTGTLKPAQTIVVNGLKGRVRAMLNDHGKRVKLAGPSMPVEILGIGGLPGAGDMFTIVPDERSARQMVDEWERTQQVERRHGTLEDIAARIESGEVVDLDLIVKTDVQGSTEAVRSALDRLNTDRTRVNIIHMATGAITENDVMLAAASGRCRHRLQHSARSGREYARCPGGCRCPLLRRHLPARRGRGESRQRPARAGDARHHRGLRDRPRGIQHRSSRTGRGCLRQRRPHLPLVDDLRHAEQQEGPRRPHRQPETLQGRRARAHKRTRRRRRGRGLPGLPGRRYPRVPSDRGSLSGTSGFLPARRVRLYRTYQPDHGAPLRQCRTVSSE